MTPKTFLSEAEAKDCCAYWQRQLRLSDWKVKVTIVRRYDLPIDRVADCTYYLSDKSAKIRLLDAGDYHPGSDFTEKDHEICLVHELNHLSWAGLEPKADSYKSKAFECAIESTARALVLLNRGIRL